MSRIAIFVLTLFSAFFLSANLTFADEPLTWEECVREASQNHPDLISAQEKVKQSQAAKKVTASSLFPQIESTASISTAGSDTGKTSSTSKTYDYGVSGSQLLFDGKKTINDIKAASETIRSREYNYKFVSSDIRFRLRSAFINLLKTQELVDIAEEIYAIRRSNLELITLRYESGLEHKGALLTAEANLAQAEFEVAQTKRSLMVAQRQLTKEMGRVEFRPLEVKGGFEIKEPLEEKPDFEALSKNNSSLRGIIAQKNAAQFSLRSTYGDFLPRLSGDVSASKSSSRWPPKNDQWNTGITLSLPVFEGGLRLAQVDQAQALLNQLKADERSTKDSIVFTLEQAFAALENAVDTIKVQQKFLEAVEERARIAEAQYSLGLIKFDNWIIIEDDLVSRKKSVLDARANALSAEASWVSAKGETLEYVE